MGALSLFKTSFYLDAYESASLGLTDKGIARRFVVSMATFNRWKALKPEFKRALDLGRKKFRAEGGLTKKQKAFIREYLIDLNPQGAARRAGYAKSTLVSTPYTLLKKPHIQRAIQVAMDQRAKKLDIDAKWVLERLIRIADANIQDCYDENGNHKSVPQLPRDLAYALRHIKTSPRMKKDGLTEEILEVSVRDQRAALELIGKHIGMFSERVDVKHAGTVLLDILDSMEQTKGPTLVDDEFIEREAENTE